MSILRRTGHRFVVAAAVFLVGAQSAFAVSEELYGKLNESLVDAYLIPHHAAFVESTGRLGVAVDRLCAMPSEATLADVRQEFSVAVLDWAGIQHLRFEPQAAVQRNFRIQFWPDRKNRTGRWIANYLRNGDVATLEPGRFRQTSVVAQGLPALERLLYEASHVDAIRQAGEGSARRCGLARAIATNLTIIAVEIRQDWARGGGFRSELLEPDEDEGYFQSAAEASGALFTHFHTLIDGALELKLLPLLGAETGKVRPRRAEYWRSGLSLASLEANLVSASEMWSVGFAALAREGGADAAPPDRVAESFSEVLTALRAIELPLHEAVATSSSRPSVERLAKAISKLRAIVRGDAGPAMGLAVGFNASDGD